MPYDSVLFLATRRWWRRRWLGIFVMFTFRTRSLPLAPSVASLLPSRSHCRRTWRARSFVANKRISHIQIFDWAHKFIDPRSKKKEEAETAAAQNLPFLDDLMKRLTFSPNDVISPRNPIAFYARFTQSIDENARKYMQTPQLVRSSHTWRMRN